MLNVTFSPWTEYLSLAVKQKGQFAVYVSNNLDYDSKDDNMIWTEFMLRANKVLDLDKSIHIIYGGLFFFDTEDEMNTFFNLFTVSPIESSGLYACNYDSDGNCLSENT